MAGSRVWRPSLTAAVALLLLATSICLALASALANRRDDGTISLADTWPAHVESQDVVSELMLPVPSLFKSVGLSGDALVSVEIQVDVRETLVHPSVYVGRVRYAVEVLWDGEPIGSRGRIGATDARERSDASLLALVPPHLAGPGIHKLTLRAEGAYGEGGILGDVRYGEMDAFMSRMRRTDMSVFGLVMSLVVLSSIQLLVVLRRPDRREHLYFAVFFSVVALFFFAQSDSWYQLFDGLDLRLRVRRGALLSCLAFAALWSNWFAYGRTHSYVRVYAWFCGILAFVAVFWPDLRVNAFVNIIGDYVIVGLFLLVPIFLIMARRQDRVAVGVMGLAVALGAISAFYDIVATNGRIANTDWTVPVFSMVAVAAGLALSLKHSDASSRLDILLQSARDGVLLLNGRGTIEQVNRAARDLLILGENELSWELSPIMSAEQASLFRTHLDSVKRNGHGRVEFCFLCGERQVWIESVGSVIEGGQILLILRDISDRRHMEAGLVRAAKMETLGVLAGGVAHDFNNLMSALLAHLGILQSRIQANDDMVPRLKRMEAIIRSAAGLTRRLLAMARGGGGSREPVDLREVVQGATSLFRPMLPEGSLLILDISEDIAPMEANGAELEEMVLNLLMNAKEAAPPENGQIRVSLQPCISEAGVRCVELVVEDNGAGIPHERRSQVFDAFFSTKPEGRGTGLGLAVVWRVSRDHGGEVLIEDSSIGGARFRVLLPVSTAKGTVPQRASGRRILLVDDEEEIREVMREYLSARGFQVAVAESHAAAEKCWQSAGGEFDLLVTDVVLGDGSGLDLASRLEKERPGLRVIIISGFIPRERVPQVLSGAWRLLDKPFRLEQLAAIASALLGAQGG